MTENGRKGEYEAAYISWLMLKRASKHLAHKDHEPDPKSFNVQPEDANWIKMRLDHEFRR